MKKKTQAYCLDILCDLEKKGCGCGSYSFFPFSPRLGRYAVGLRNSIGGLDVDDAGSHPSEFGVEPACCRPPQRPSVDADAGEDEQLGVAGGGGRRQQFVGDRRSDAVNKPKV